MSDETDRTLNRRQVIVGASFLGTTGVALARQPTHHIDLLGKRKLEEIVPEHFGKWSYYSKSGLVVPPQDQLSQMLYSQLLTRVYNAPDQPPIMLLVAQSAGETGVLQIHRPEICYPAGGYKLSPSAVHPIRLADGGLSSTAFTARSDNRTEQLLYWTRIGRDMPTSWLQQRWSIAKANLLGQVPDAVLVRISMLYPDQEGALALLDDFARGLLNAMPPGRRAVLADMA